MFIGGGNLCCSNRRPNLQKPRVISINSDERGVFELRTIYPWMEGRSCEEALVAVMVWELKSKEPHRDTPSFPVSG